MAKDSIVYKSNRAGMVKLMQSKGMERVVGDAADRISLFATSQGHGYFGSKTKIQSVSAHGYVYTGDFHAMRAEAKYGILNRSI